MADKSFGVKELNLLNASGTPTITSPNNLNLNANTVAISTSVTIGHNLTVSANAGIASLNVTGVSTFVGLTTFRSDIHIVGNQAIDINNNALLLRGNNGGNGFITNGVGDLYLTNATGTLHNDAFNNFSVKTNTSEQAILATKNGSVSLYHDGGNKKLETTSNGIDVTGAITVNGSALSIDPTNSDVQVAYTVTANSNSAYRFAGNGVVSTADNPDLYLIRGQKYRFINNSGGNHPFRIQSDNSSTLYSTGVTNNNASTGNIDFAPTFDSPSHLYYKCGNHGAMLGNIYIVGQHLANGADNRVLTATSAYGMNAESGLTYNGQKLQVDTVTSESNAFRLYNTTTSATTYQINGEGDSFTGNVYPRSDGNLDLGFHSGYKWRDLVLNGGVRFGSANAQDYLDDYEEGSWTPQVKGTTGAGTASYSQQVGKYIKIGSWVYLTWVLAWSSGSAGGELRTTNLPFSPATDCTGMGSVMFNNISIHSNVSNIATYVGPGNDYCYFYTSRTVSYTHLTLPTILLV